MKREDTLPWYRQFWPWFIMILPASAVVAGLATVWIAMQGGDSLIMPADEGMEILTERRNAAEQRARHLGLDASIDIDPDSGAIRVSMASATLGEWPPSLSLLISHPTNVQLDRVVSLNAAMPGEHGEPRWAGHVSPVPSGRRYLVLSAANDWRLYGVWNGGRSIRLRPETAGDDHGGR